MLIPSRLADIGMALHGVRWKAATARDMGISPRMMAKYLSPQKRKPGEKPRIATARRDKRERLAVACRERARLLDCFADELLS